MSGRKLSSKMRKMSTRQTKHLAIPGIPFTISILIFIFILFYFINQARARVLYLLRFVAISYRFHLLLRYACYICYNLQQFHTDFTFFCGMLDTSIPSTKNQIEPLSLIINNHRQLMNEHSPYGLAATLPPRVHDAKPRPAHSIERREHGIIDQMKAMSRAHHIPYARDREHRTPSTAYSKCMSCEPPSQSSLRRSNKKFSTTYGTPLETQSFARGSGFNIALSIVDREQYQDFRIIINATDPKRYARHTGQSEMELMSARTSECTCARPL